MNLFKKKEPNMMTVAEQFVAKVEKEARSSLIRVYAPMILLVCMTIFFSIYDSHFFSIKNILNILQQMSVPLILASGLTFVLLIGRIDLSVEGVMGFVAAYIALLIQNDRNSNDFGVWGVLIPIAIGIAYGFLTGILHVKLRIASFIITHATGTMIKAIAILLYDSRAARVQAQWMSDWSMASFLGIPVITWIAFGFFFICCIILNFTAFGRAVYAIGDNEAAARASGINVDRITVLVFGLSSIAASLAGFVALVRLKFGQASVGDDQMFPCITALVVGGTSLSGGKGGMLQTMVGILIYMELLNFLTIIGVDANYKKALQGLIIIVAVALTVARDRKTIAK